jgi:oligopeptide transport system substrate-binding protein
VALCAGLLVAGCTTEQPPKPRIADEAAQPGGVLRVGTTPPGSVDPGNVYEPVGELVVRTMCTPLLAADPDTGEVVPAIASSWLVSEGGSSISLRLRDDVVFSDGTRLTAADVAFSLSRIASADYASTSAERLRPIDGWAEMHGDEPTNEDLDRRRLRGVLVRDDENLQINLVAPQADFVRVLTSPLTAPVSRAAAERDPRGVGRNPVCVGPYRLGEPFTPGAETLRLERSEHFTPVDSSRTRGGRSYADSIHFRFYADDSAAAAAAAAGEVDVAPARPEDTDGVQVGPSPMVEYVGLPASLTGFEEPEVRRALALALDREELVRRVFPRTREAADGFLPRTSPADDDCDALPPAGDVAAARDLLGGDLSGMTVPLYFNDELRNRELAEEVARQWREALGLRVTPTPMTFAELLAKGTSAQGFDGMFRFSWAVPYPDVDGYLHPLFTSDRIGRDNLSRFSDPDVDEAIVRLAREAEDEEDRQLAYARVTDLLCEAMPMVPVSTGLSRWLVADGVGSAVARHVDGATGQPLLTELYLR